MIKGFIVEYDTSSYCGENVWWSLNSAGTLTIGGSGPMFESESVDWPWTSKRDSIKRIVVGNGVTTIGAKAFEYCSNVESVVLPNSLTKVGNSAFYNCQQLATVNMQNKVTSIGAYAFSNCENLKTMTLPASLTALGKECFNGCSGISYFAVNENNPNYCSLDGVLYNKDKTELIRYPSASSSESFIIPDSVTTIAERAFHLSKNLKNIAFGKNVAIIGEYAFNNCTGITSIVIPDSVERINYASFWGCTELTNVDFGKGVKYIGIRAFSACKKLETVIIPATVTTVREWSFAYCTNITDVYFRGSEAQWNNIVHTAYILQYNNATVHYNYQDHTHSYVSAVTKDPTCSATGIRSYTCTCGSSYTETIDKIPHQTTVINAKAATTTEEGYTGDTYCTVCKQTISKGSAIPKLTEEQAAQQDQQQSGACRYCGGTHTGFPGVIIGFFHSILALFGLKK